MRWSNVLLITGFGLAALSSTSAKEYGQWNTSWIDPAWKALQIVPNTVGHAYSGLLQNANKSLYGGEAAPVATEVKIKGRDRGCLPSTISEHHNGVALPDFQNLEKLGKGAIGSLDSKRFSELLKSTAYCQIDGTKARWLMADGSSLDANFDEGGVLKGWRREVPSRNFSVLGGGKN
jgi:hypothetical protein